mmetsp:Transcript_15487/g.14018  ORF Transcript_15487/g.14018 Transcript_15487/m.14018 type:complete len:222 (-) Transcript_15487:55-720(-)
MWNLFGKKKKSVDPPPAPVDAIRNLRDQIALLEKRENLLQQRIIQSTQEALKKKTSNDTAGALFELKRKKLFEAEIAKLQGSRITLDSQIMALESAAINVQTVQAMKSGAEVMKGIHGNLDVDKVEDLLDSIKEQNDIHETIADAISRPGQEMFDDDQLLEELALVGNEPGKVQNNVQNKNQDQTSHVFLPMAPNSAVSVPQSKESDLERELRELEASMLA